MIPESSLAALLSLGNPRYRLRLAQLVSVGLLASLLVYLQNGLLKTLTLALGGAVPPSARQWLGTPSWLQAALAVLVLLIAVRLLLAAAGFWRVQTNGNLSIAIKDDLESEVLTHLVQRDDRFFAQHSPAETINRLGLDLLRVSRRMPILSEMTCSVLLLCGDLLFFLQQDWRFAATALGACAANAAWMIFMMRPVEKLDASYLREDDRVKSRFEDLLRAAPEIQVGRLVETVRRRFSRDRKDRTRMFLSFVRVRGGLSAGGEVVDLLAFVLMVLVIVQIALARGMQESLALVAVALSALPRMLSYSAALIGLTIEFRLARTSLRRLLEYESHRPAEAPSATMRDLQAPHGAIRLDGVTYRHAGIGDSMQGGVDRITTEFPPGRWIALVGGAGSGKSTLLHLVLDRLKPQQGSIAYGGRELATIPGQALGRVFGFLPQTPVLLDSSIEQNLLFGRSGSRGPHEPGGESLSGEDLATIEELGLGDVCRLKAIDMVPTKPGLDAVSRAGIAGIRGQVRTMLEARCGISPLPFERGHFDPGHWHLEALLGGGCDREKILRLLLGARAVPALRHLAGSELDERLASTGRAVLGATANLLKLRNFQTYSQLAPHPLPQALWELRSSHSHLAQAPPETPAERLALWRTGLTCSPAELATVAAPPLPRIPPAGEETQRRLEPLRAFLAGSWMPFDVAQVHPHLTWRENLVFGVVETPNSRVAQQVEQALRDFIGASALREIFTREGLRFGVGRLGKNLSGGQGQLVALGRAVLRAAPVLVLDEPTSALDPLSRERVARFLRREKEGRIVLTVSHDPAFVRKCDEVRVLDKGCLVASGPFEEVARDSNLFQRLFQEHGKTV